MFSRWGSGSPIQAPLDADAIRAEVSRDVAASRASRRPSRIVAMLRRIIARFR
ncbi:MAG: hypothetical protein ACSLFM_04620 [Tepidiformaceae bacterium]